MGVSQMKVRIINKHGFAWDFDTMKDARPHIKNRDLDDFEIKVIGSEKVCVYDDRIPRFDPEYEYTARTF